MKVAKMLISTLALFCVLTIPAYATSKPQIIIKDGATNVPQEVIDSLIEENPQAGVITIYGYGEFENNVKSSPVNTRPEQREANIMYGPTRTTFSNVRRGVTLKKEFKFSVAKGQSVTIKKRFTTSFSGTANGDPLEIGKLGLTLKVEGMFEVGTTYNGPAENSQFNSRSFFIDIYGETGNYTQTRTKTTLIEGGQPIGTVTETRQGTYKNPTTWRAYSADYYIN